MSSRVSESSGRPVIRCFSVAPSRNSIAMKGWPSCSQLGYFLRCNSWFLGDNRRRCGAPTFLNDSVSGTAEAIKRRNAIEYP